MTIDPRRMMQDRPRTVTRTEQESAGLLGPRPARPPTLVPAQRQEIMPRLGEVLPPVQMSDLPMPPVMHGVEMKGSYSDRGRAFVYTTTPLAVVAGVLGIIAGVALVSVPLFSMATLLWFFTCFCLTWLCAFAIYTVTSQDGISLVHTLKAWGHVRSERSFRHKMIEQLYEDRYGRNSD